MRLPNGLIASNTGLQPVLLLPSLVKDVRRSEMDAPTTPRNYTISAVTGGVNVTIATHEVKQFFNAGMQNATMVRI